jgi:hypothetical protein
MAGVIRAPATARVAAALGALPFTQSSPLSSSQHAGKDLAAKLGIGSVDDSSSDTAAPSDN